MKVLRLTDVVTLKHEGVEVDFTPLRYDVSLELNQMVTVVAGRSVVDSGKQTAMMIKHSVKDIRGLTDYDGKAIEIKAVNGMLSDDDVSTAISVLVRTRFIEPISYISCSSVPKNFDGVEIQINGKVLDLGKA